jgi:uncharacterized phiE125 gp8 family phage protein
VQELVIASRTRTALSAGPVQGIDAVASLDEAGTATALAGESFAAGVDAGGEGWVQLLASVDAPRLRVSYRAGMAVDWNGVPEMLRHGIIRLAAQYYLRRDGSETIEIPTAVTALWRPWRRLRLK